MEVYFAGDDVEVRVKDEGEEDEKVAGVLGEVVQEHLLLGDLGDVVRDEELEG